MSRRVRQDIKRREALLLEAQLRRRVASVWDATQATQAEARAAAARLEGAASGDTGGAKAAASEVGGGRAAMGGEVPAAASLDGRPGFGVFSREYMEAAAAQPGESGDGGGGGASGGRAPLGAEWEGLGWDELVARSDWL